MLLIREQDGLNDISPHIQGPPVSTLIPTGAVAVIVEKQKEQKNLVQSVAKPPPHPQGEPSIPQDKRRGLRK